MNKNLKDCFFFFSLNLNLNLMTWRDDEKHSDRQTCVFAAAVEKRLKQTSLNGHVWCLAEFFVCVFYGVN